MTGAAVNIATLYSSAQCVLSVVGSVGVILLFAGIPQLIYSPSVSIANLMTFLLGAILITTMVAGNAFLNYKYRKFTRAVQQSQRDANSTEAAASRVEADDKPPSYEAIITLDGLPPDYFSILSEKPPRYEDVAGVIYTVGSITPAVSLDSATSTDTSGLSSSCRSDPHNPARLENLPRVLQPKGITISNGEEPQVTPSKSKNVEKTTTVTTATTKVTIGYDNDAYSRQEESSSPGGSSSSSSSTDLRESES